MENFKVVIEHDFFSRKPIQITFNMKVVHTGDGSILHSKTCKYKDFKFGLYESELYKRRMLKPEVLSTLMASDLSEKFGIEMNFEEGIDGFIKDVFKSSSTEFLKDYLVKAKHAGDIEEAKKELKLRGEL